MKYKLTITAHFRPTFSGEQTIDFDSFALKEAGLTAEQFGQRIYDAAVAGEADFHYNENVHVALDGDGKPINQLELISYKVQEIAE